MREMTNSECDGVLVSNTLAPGIQTERCPKCHYYHVDAPVTIVAVPLDFRPLALPMEPTTAELVEMSDLARLRRLESYGFEADLKGRAAKIDEHARWLDDGGPALPEE